MSLFINRFYKNKKEIEDNKKLTRHLQKLLLIKLENWKDYKPTRGIIEDFFKAAKGAFGLGKIPQLHRQIHVQKHLFMLIINSNCRANRIQNKNTTTTTSRRKNRISTTKKEKHKKQEKPQRNQRKI